MNSRRHGRPKAASKGPTPARARLGALATAAAMVAVTIAAVTAGPAAATNHSDRPTAVVSLGDSYISGEAGRWEGNSSRNYGDRRGTDRAAYKRRWSWRYDKSRIYGPSAANGCHRSDTAPVISSGIDVDELINLACAGANTSHLIRSANGGSSHKGEPSQADQLADVANSHNVEMIVVSIGGNDLGFGSIIVDCAVDYLLSTSRNPRTCRDDQQANIDAKMGRAMADVGTVLDEITSIMAEAGYIRGQYRLVLQSYASPVPSGDEFRYRQSGWSRTFSGRCPFWNADATWARDSFVPQLSRALATVAASRGAEFLDLQDALDGREACAKGVSQGDGANAEWARFVTLGLVQGDIQESLHPNALGQQANGTCLRLLAEARPGNYRCTNVAGAGPETMNLTSR